MRSKKPEIIVLSMFGGLEQVLQSWKDYPDDQFLREEIIMNILESQFKVPENCPSCNAKIELELKNEGWMYICKSCGTEVPAATHRIFASNNEMVCMSV